MSGGLGGWIDRWSRRALLGAMQGLREGRLILEAHGETHRFGQEEALEGLRATVTIHDPKAWSAMVLGGSVGAGESYMSGAWSADDLTALIRVLLRNREVIDVDRGIGRLAEPLRRAAHTWRANTLKGSRRNISDHYDLGNDFFSIVLDHTMMYSCAIFGQDDEDLQTASIRKLERVCDKLSLGPDDEVLEIGTGWGGFALHAAARHGCRVVTTTISGEQRRLATLRVREAGLEDRVTVLGLDYRDLAPALGRRFDKVVSIEMIEAVGERYLSTYMRACADLLSPGGLMLLQSIVIADRLYPAYRRSVDFIQRYVFPGGFLPSVGVITADAGAAGLQVVGLDDITSHYPITLRRWRENFHAGLDRVRALGYPDRFIRLWDFYLAYCEAGFLERTVGDCQIVLAGPRWKGPVAAGRVSK